MFFDERGADATDCEQLRRGGWQGVTFLRPGGCNVRPLWLIRNPLIESRQNQKYVNQHRTLLERTLRMAVIESDTI
jgi:hypothetical protein